MYLLFIPAILVVFWIESIFYNTHGPEKGQNSIDPYNYFYEHEIIECSSNNYCYFNRGNSTILKLHKNSSIEYIHFLDNEEKVYELCDFLDILFHENDDVKININNYLIDSLPNTYGFIFNDYYYYQHKLPELYKKWFISHKKIEQLGLGRSTIVPAVTVKLRL